MTTGVGLLDEVLAAHGGLERWQVARRITARTRTGGLLPRTRFPGNRMAAGSVTVETERQRTAFDPFPTEGRRAVFEGGRVWVEDAAGEVLEAREDPRAAFYGLSGLRRNLRWDALDVTYFAGYAIWNYLTTPLLLTRKGIQVREGSNFRQGRERLRRLEVSFPPELHTHSPEQTFYVDRRGLLRRHDYTPEVIGHWARGAHHLDAHREFDGLLFPTRRWVRPVGPRNRSLPGPTLVAVEVETVSVEFETAQAV